MTNSLVYFAIKHRLDAEFLKLDRDKITHWLMRISSGRPTDIDDCRGGRITTGGNVKFDGTIRHVYWTFITPCLADIVEETLTAADEIGRKHSPALALKGLDEAAALLKEFGRRTFRRMVEVDRALRGAGYPERVDPYDARPQIAGFEQLVDARCQALKELLPTGFAAIIGRIEGSKLLLALVSALIGAIITTTVGLLLRVF